MGLKDILPIIEADNREIVMRDTWGHLAPKKKTSYKGRIVFAVGAFDDLNPEPIFCEFEGLDSSPWFYNSLMEWLSDNWGRQSGKVFEWTGTFKNYEFNGEAKVVYDANRSD